MENQEKYYITISPYSISLSEIVAKDENSMRCRVIENVFSENHYKLPYSYSMGGKISKKAMKETLKGLI